MTINRTTLLDLPLPVTGTESGTWGDTTNNGLTQYMDIAIAGMSNLTSANFTAGALTIETTEGTNSAPNIVATSAQYAGFRVTSLAQNSTITVGNTGTSPARSYRLINADATYTLTFKATGQTGVTLLPGQSAVVAFNGTDYVIVGMVGAGTATDNAIARFDGTTGEIVQNSVVTIADSTGDVSGVGSITSTSASGILTRAAATQDGVELIGRAGGSSSYKVTLTPATLGGNRTLTLPDTTGTVALTGSTVASFSAGSTGFTPNSATTGAVTLGGTLATTNGGTGLTSFTANGVVYASSSSALATGSALTFDGTSLGIGTTSTGNKLVISNAGAAGLEINPTLRDGSTAGAFLLSYNRSGSAYVPMQVDASNIQFLISNTERMTLDASGNLGLGVTPSAWSGIKPLEVLGGFFGGNSSQTGIWQGQNTYYNGSNWIYKTSAAATYAVQAQGGFSWFTAPSGTAGNAITFTQAMTLDASGNLGVGSTSPTTVITLAINNNFPFIHWNNSSNTTIGFMGWHGGSGGGDDFRLGTVSTKPITFYTNNTERARITSGGDLLVGITTSGGGNRLIVESSGSGTTAVLGQAPDAAGNPLVAWNKATAGDNTFALFGTEGSFTSRGSITYNRVGGLVAYNTSSDYRAKDILGSVTDSGATIDALKVYEGKMKGATQSRPMLVAHEAQEVAPYAVTGEKDAVNDDGTPKYQQMDVSSFVPLLIAEIQSLRQRVVQLEGA